MCRIENLLAEYFNFRFHLFFVSMILLKSGLSFLLFNVRLQTMKTFENTPELSAQIIVELSQWVDFRILIEFFLILK